MAEIELKFDLAPKAHAAFRRLPALAGASARTTRLRATYFDTPEFELRERQMALRLRRSGGRWIQTLKAGRSGAGGLHAREEWEADRPDASLDLGLLADTPLAAHPGIAERLGEVFTVVMSRTAWEVEVSPGNRVEVALDRGEVRHGERCEVISEVEIESLAGNPLAVFELAERLMQGPSSRGGSPGPALMPSAVTKAQRGYRLARDELAVPARAVPAALDAGMSPAQAVRAMAGAALEQLQANRAGVLAGTDPEYLHQFRVALRRLRSALGLFRAAVGPEAEALREELRWIAGLTGPARDWDVFVASTLPTLLEAYASGAMEVRRRADDRRREANERLREALGSPRFARLLLALARWLAGPAPAPGPGEESLIDFASRAIGKRRKRLVRDARSLSASTPDERHALRLDAKRLRYALEGLAPLFRRGRVRDHVEALSEIQDDLGRANDAAVASRLLAELRPAAPLAQFSRGWFGAQAHASAEGLGRHARRLASTRALKVRPPSA